jgi:hypothetical protein
VSSLPTAGAACSSAEVKLLVKKTDKTTKGPTRNNLQYPGLKHHDLQ